MLCCAFEDLCTARICLPDIFRRLLTSCATRQGDWWAGSSPTACSGLSHVVGWCPRSSAESKPDAAFMKRSACGAGAPSKRDMCCFICLNLSVKGEKGERGDVQNIRGTVVTSTATHFSLCLVWCVQVYRQGWLVSRLSKRHTQASCTVASSTG